jgi:hypothetical protein
VSAARWAAARSHRAQMRMYALEAREQIAPDGIDFGTFSERCERAAKFLSHAIFYRDLAARTVGKAKEWDEATRMEVAA